MGLIGIAGGMGPLAGLDLSRKIISQTNAAGDQGHVAQSLYSVPELIGDRTEYILGNIKQNPAYAIAEILLRLEKMGATVAALPCNSAHAPIIFNKIQLLLQKNKSSLQLLNMVEEVARFITLQFPGAKKTGILGTTGTYVSQQYKILEKYGLELVNVSEEEQKAVHASIYHPGYGIKASNNGTSDKSRQILMQAAETLINNGAEVIVLACTELPLVFREKKIGAVPLLDTTLILARALVNVVAPSKLLPYK